MARTVTEIKNTMTAMFVGNTTVQAIYGINGAKTFDEEFSAVSLENIIFYIVAFCAWTLETLFDTHRADMEALYRNHHAHTLNWYVTKAKAFMFGKNLIPFTSNYDTTGMSAEEITAAQIVTYAACARARQSNRKLLLRLKVAKGDETREKLTDIERSAFTGYIEEIQDAGVDLEVISRDPDHIRMSWTVYYDPQILDPDGNRLDGSGSDVVREAIKAYIQTLPFNGVYVQAFHVDAVQAVPGVMVPEITSVSTSISGTDIWESNTPAGGIIAEAGWFKFYNESDLEIDMQPFNFGENV